MRHWRCWLGHKWETTSYMQSGGMSTGVPRGGRCVRCGETWAMKPWPPPPSPQRPDETAEQYEQRCEKALDEGREPIHPEQIKAARRQIQR